MVRITQAQVAQELINRHPEICFPFGFGDSFTDEVRAIHAELGGNGRLPLSSCDSIRELADATISNRC